jgi:hypothetical protein
VDDCLVPRGKAGCVVMAVNVAVLLVAQVAKVQDGGEAGEDGIRGGGGDLDNLEGQAQGIKLGRRLVGLMNGGRL